MIPSALLRDTVTLQVYRGPNAYGPAYEAPIEVPARFEHRSALVRQGDGRQVVSRAVALLRPTVNVTPQSELIHEGEIYSVVHVAVRSTASRSFYLEVLLG